MGKVIENARRAADMDGNFAVSAATPLRPEPAVLRALEQCAPKARL
jgi:hypothetical protein